MSKPGYQLPTAGTNHQPMTPGSNTFQYVKEHTLAVLEGLDFKVLGPAAEVLDEACSPPAYGLVMDLIAVQSDDTLDKPAKLKMEFKLKNAAVRDAVYHWLLDQGFTDLAKNYLDSCPAWSS